MGRVPPAGQNKWSKLKHIKGLRDTERSRLFQKLTMLLRFVRKAGGPNPDFNTNRANLTEQCRSMVLTKEYTEVAIKGRVMQDLYLESASIAVEAAGDVGLILLPVYPSEAGSLLNNQWGDKSEELSQIEVSLEEVLELIDKLNSNKSRGPTGIHPRVLKELKCEIAELLTMVCNLSFK
ncbi:unnamed protein product [Eretmochelys imbricata]